MVHRRCLADDRRGVDEPLNETGTSGLGLVITGIHAVTLDFASNSTVTQQDLVQRLTFPPVILLAPLSSTVADFVAHHPTVLSGLTAPLPPNVHLLTLQNLANYSGAGVLLVRLAHLFAVGENLPLSKPVSVNLQSNT